MPQKLITPKFLTRAVAEASCTAVLRAVKENRDLFPLDGDTHHIVVLVPGMEDGRPDYPAWPDYQLHPVTLFEHSRGEKSKWNFPFDDIARCKAMQLWHDRNDDRTDCVPHLLFPGDTPYWGGVKRRGVLAQPLAFIKSEESDTAACFLENFSADHRTGLIIYEAEQVNCLPR